MTAAFSNKLMIYAARALCANSRSPIALLHRALSRHIHSTKNYLLAQANVPHLKRRQRRSNSMTQHVYTIVGIPEATLKSTKMSRAPQDAYNIRRLNYQQQIINQHADQPFITGAWNLEAHFMFPRPHGKSKRHAMYPSLISLLRFFDELAHGVIYDDSCLIYEATLIKTYESFEPQSKFIFTRVS